MVNPAVSFVLLYDGPCALTGGSPAGINRTSLNSNMTTFTSRLSVRRQLGLIRLITAVVYRLSERCQILLQARV